MYNVFKTENWFTDKLLLSPKTFLHTALLKIFEMKIHVLENQLAQNFSHLKRHHISSEKVLLITKP